MKKLFIFLTALFITSLNADSSNIPLNNLISLEKEKIIAGIDPKDIYDICDDSDKIRLFYEAYMNSYDNSDPLNPNALLWEMDKFDHHEKKELLSKIRKYKYILFKIDCLEFNSENYSIEKEEFKYPTTNNKLEIVFRHRLSEFDFYILLNGPIYIKMDIPSAKSVCSYHQQINVYVLAKINKANFGCNPNDILGDKIRIIDANIVKYFVLDSTNEELYQSSFK